MIGESKLPHVEYKSKKTGCTVSWQLWSDVTRGDVKCCAHVCWLNWCITVWRQEALRRESEAEENNCIQATGTMMCEATAIN